ncbi:hypothetical protein LGN06_07970 [Burkholderia vietnamiensis]|uniref:hypothetical protein n=1 Tax=Burkholderia vietnamiensis TaxID=60552 RepID=UPI001CF30F68|nr:hypothetical protein [Burkholderia vietnamiensis]MCA8391497.1 hypothetical protein [Burkholderia vietnamiensis]HDR8957036.1 hypothetical protein [Burkholderia vietnamiensis]HDR9243665.1 hypothetical protein [Burkholderia vietnamiensis]
MMAVYAVVENGIVVNTIEWDGTAQWAVPIGCSLQQVPAGAYVGIGSTFDGRNFTAPPASPMIVM